MARSKNAPYKFGVKFLALTSILLILPAIVRSELIFFGGQTIGNSNFGIGAPLAQFDEVYDDFEMSVPTRVSSIFCEVYGPIVGGVVIARKFEIRTGLSAGNPGTLVASGENLPTSVEALTGVPPTSSFHRVRISGLDIELAAGRYWMMMYLSQVLLLSETRGQNGVGSHLGNGNAFLTSPFSTAYFRPIEGGTGQPAPDFGYGVEGTVVPEPATLATLGFAALAAFRRRRPRGTKSWSN